MDTILNGILSSNHPDNLKKTLIKKIASHGMKPHPVEDIKSVLDLSAKWFLESENDIAVAEGLCVYKTWAKYNISTFEEFFTRDFLLRLLSTKFSHEANSVILLHESLTLLQRSSALNGHLQVVEAKAISFIREHPSLKSLSLFCDFLKEFRTCIPKGDFSSTFCVSLIHCLSICSVPDNPADICTYIKEVENVSSVIQIIWSNTDSDIVLESLKSIFRIISSANEDDVEPAFCLGTLVQFIPTEMIKNVAKYAISSADIDNTCMTAALQRIIDWLQWPTAKNIDQWIIAFLKGLASAKRYSVLINVTESKIEKVFERIQFPVVRDGAINVVSHMLLSFQHSPEPFHKVLVQTPAIFTVLAQENTTSSHGAMQRLSDLFHCCMYLHAGYPDLYDSVITVIKDFPKPSGEVIKDKLQDNKWTAQGSNYVSKVTQRSETGKTGLFNLGNTCYMNSVLQVLFMCDDFRREVLSLSITSPEQKLLAKLQYVFAFLSHTQRPAYAPMMFVQMSRPPWFETGHQQDCSEYLKYLIDQLHEQQVLVEKKKISNKSEIQEDGDVIMALDGADNDKISSTVIRNQIGGKMLTSYTCLNCHNTSSRSEDFIDIPLAFPQTITSSEEDSSTKSEIVSNESENQNDANKISHDNKTSSPKEKQVGKQDTGTETCNGQTVNKPLHLNDLLQFYLQPEKLTGDNKYHCDKCEGLQEGERKLKVVKPPNHLILTLLRFSYDVKRQKRSKIFKEVKYPRTLILPVETDTSSQTNGCRTTEKDAPSQTDDKRRSIRSAVTRQIQKCGLNVNTKRGEVYGLCGVVVHSGTSSECGHYYSYARHSVYCDTDSICDTLETCTSEDDIDFLQDKWYLFNDNRVSYSTYSSFCDVTQRFTKDTAYVLFYKRIDPQNAEKVKLDLNGSFRITDIDSPLRADLRAAISKDNTMYLQEQESVAQKRNARKRPGSAYSSSWVNWQNKDDDDNGPPGSCGGGKGGYGDVDTSGAKFIF